MHDAPDPNLLRSEQRDVTLLFADMRGFTELAAFLQTNPLVSELLAHLMDDLSEAVAKQDGYIVDYYGDGLVAMWNAPSEQQDHAARACCAGLQMLQLLPEISAEWRTVINSELHLGIGIHSGAVQVGNAGSSRKVKYGPRGPNVNLTSRVESATKELGVPLIATRASVEQVSDEFAAHRVCRAQMPGMDQPVELYSVNFLKSDARLATAWRAYDDALRQYECDSFDAAAETLAAIDETITEVPWRFLRERVQNELGRQRRRRSTDKPSANANGVILLSEK